MVEAMTSQRIALPVATHLFLATIASAAASLCFVPSIEAQTPQAQPAPFLGVVVVGEGRVTVVPDYAQIASGVTTRGKTAKEASDANSKTMAAIVKALLDSGVAQNDIQTSRFSVQPVYLPQGSGTEPKLAGYSVSNQVRAKIRQVDKLGDILDRLITAGATDVGNIELLVSDPSKALDQAREAAIATALVWKAIKDGINKPDFDILELTPALSALGHSMHALPAAFEQAIDLQEAEQRNKGMRT